MQSNDQPEVSSSGVPKHVYQRIGNLTRQLHDSLNELGYADQLRGTVDRLPDAKSRLSYISRLTGEAAEKVLNRVEAAKALQEKIADETRDMAASLVKDPVAAVAKGRVMNYTSFVEESTQAMDQHLTEIMMAQDFHDLTGQVIAKVVNLAATIEEQLVQLLLQTAQPGAPVAGTPTPLSSEELNGPVVDASKGDVVTDQSQVDDLLASLGF